MTKKWYKGSPGDNLNTIIEDMTVDGYSSHGLYLNSGTILTPPIKLIDNLSITFHGTSLMAKRGEFSTADCRKSWRGPCALDSGTGGVDNFRMSGRGRVSMERIEIDPSNSGRHCLNLEGCSNVYINGIEFAHGRGDCIMIGVNHPCQNVQLRDVTCKGGHRNCISVTNVIGLLMNKVTCVGAVKGSGIDFEPGKGGFIQQTHLYNTLSWFNKADGIQIDCGKSFNFWDIFINGYKSKGNGGRHLSTNNYHPTAGPPGRLVVLNGRVL